METTLRKMRQFSEVNDLSLSAKAIELIKDIRNKDGYGYGAESRKVSICDAICELSSLSCDNEEQKVLLTVMRTLSEYNELVTALSEVRV